MQKLPVSVLALSLLLLLSATTAQAQSSETPTLTELRFYFQHLAALDDAADKADAEGTPGADTDGWRRYEQNAAGLNDREAAILKDVAYRCNQAIQNRESAPEPRPGVMEILSAAADELRAHLAPEAFESLTRRIQSFIRPGIVEMPAVQASAAEGGELPLEAQAQTAQTVAVQVLSLTFMLPDGFFVAQCATARNDPATDQGYAAGVTSCFLHGTGMQPFPLSCSGPDGLCMATFPPAAPGQQRWTQASHFLRMYFSQNCLNSGAPGLQDPLHYCGRNPLPSIEDMADIPPLGGSSMCWPGSNEADTCPIALSKAFPVTYLDISPRQATVTAGGELQFATFNNLLARWSVTTGPGQINDTGLYTAPPSVDSPQTATVTACDSFVLSYCVNATITVTPLKVEVGPTGREVLPATSLELTAVITPSAPGQELEWTATPEDEVGILVPSGSTATYTAWRDDLISRTTDVTIQACVKTAPTVCGTATVTVPKLVFLVTGSKTKLGPGESMQVTAFVGGSSVPRNVTWSEPRGGNGTLTPINDADPFIRLYTAPPWPVDEGIDIEACLTDAPGLCASHHVDLGSEFRLDNITSDTGRWQAGTLTQFTITGNGFTEATEVHLGDLNVTVTSVTGTTIRGRVNILVATTSMAPLLQQPHPLGGSTDIATSPIPVEPATVSVVPPAAQVQAGGTVSLTASCLTSTTLGCTSLELPTWTASPGTITSTGMTATYTAPATVQSSTTASISACWSSGSQSRCAPAQVTVAPKGPFVAVSPKTVSLQPGRTQQFTAQVTNDPNTAVTWSIAPQTGTISSTGLYTAPATFGGTATVTVTATSQADGTRKDTAAVTLVPAPLTLTSTPSPATVNLGTTLSWTATASGGIPGTYQYALFRRKSGTTTWLPALDSPAWQTGNLLKWTPAAADVGTWDIRIGARDSNTPVNAPVLFDPGPVQVLAPLTIVCTPSPPFVDPGTTVTWTVTASGGTGVGRQYAMFRRRVGTVPWTPEVTSPAWQAGNLFAWLTRATEIGTWEFSIWARDSGTPPTQNTFGYGASCNPGPVQVLAPVSLVTTPSPAAAYSGQAITWTATASGNIPETTQFALFRRKVGASTWTPARTAPAWQTANKLSWTPAATETGNWEILIWVRDGSTPPTLNTYGYAASSSPGQVNVVPPMSLTGTVSPATATYGNPLSWTATASGGTEVGRQYAFFRRRAGTTPWIPDVTNPSWQTSNVLTWTPVATDVGTWETYIWVKDSATPPTMNTYGHAAWYNSGTVQIVAPLGLTCTPSPAASYSGQTLTWTATASGGVPATTQFALFRRKAGTTAWTPAVTAPAWQSGNELRWPPASTDVGVWEILIWVRDGNTPPTLNGYGYAASCNPGQVNVVTPLTLTGTVSPATATYDNQLTWTATASGGTGTGRQYAFFRRRTGTTAWTPDVTRPAWQTSNVLSWTPAAADVGTWETYIWVKDSATPPTMNTYGHAAWYNSGTVQIVAPLGLTCTPSPALVTHGNTLTWTATASGGAPSTTQFALRRRKTGTTAWAPASPAWQTSNVLSWTPGSADVATWEIAIWVRDGNTPSTMNGGGYAATCNPGSVRVVAPLTVTGTGSPAAAYHGNPIEWTASGSGGTGVGRQYALFRRKVGATSWIPALTSPAWQSDNDLSWTPASSDVGTWEIVIWFKDANTAPNANSYGFDAYYNAGPVQVFAHPTVSGTGSPASAVYGTTLSWTATASGGTGSPRQYALFRRKTGTTTWIPSLGSPAWQSGNTLSWTPSSADVGTWEIFVWLKDADTPSTMNGYGYAAYYNAGPVQVVAPPLTLGCTRSPATATFGTTITWTATATGGHPPTLQYALFRRLAGTSSWIPAVTSPAWQSSNVLSWTPSGSDIGTWEIYLWVKDGTTPANMNTYGYAAGCNAGPVQVTFL